VGPGLRQAQFNKGVYWQVTFRWSDRCPRASCGCSAASCGFLQRPRVSCGFQTDHMGVSCLLYLILCYS